MFKIRGVGTVVIILLEIFLTAVVAHGQDNGPDGLEISLRRDFGYALAGQVQGSFSIIVNSRYDLDRVEYYLDEHVIGETFNSPHRFSFETKDYPAGTHRIVAIGYTPEGQQIRSNSIVRQFVPGNTVTIIVVVIIGLVVVARLGSYLLTRRSSESSSTGNYGFLGGAICPNCERPFSIHWWSLRLGFARYDRCPHCGKWHLARRASSEKLEEVERKGDEARITDLDGLDIQQDDDYKRLIDESRYDSR